VALGIGANTGIFSVVNSILLKPLPYRNPDRLVVALHSGTFLDYKRQVPEFEQMEAAQAWGGALSGAEKTEVISGLQVTANLIPMLGIAPRLGRWFTPEENRAGAPRVILLSHFVRGEGVELHPRLNREVHPGMTPRRLSPHGGSSMR
jgi:putative ABC transport system permease protein